MIHFVFIRHGQTQWNKERRFQGSLDSALTTTGKIQIKRFVKEVSAYKPDAIFSSTLKRCKDSAVILAKPLNKRIKEDKRLNELNFGAWESHTADELIASKDASYAKWYQGQAVTPKGGESMKSLERRIESFVKHCRRKYDNKKFIVVTHGGCIRMFIKVLLQLPRKQMFYFRVDPGTMTVIGDYNQTRQLIQTNSRNPIKGIVPNGCV